MSVTRAITIQLDSRDYERLEAEAERLVMAPAALVRGYVRAHLMPAEEESAARRRGLAALDELRVLRETLRRTGYPSVDAVALMREARNELEHR